MTNTSNHSVESTAKAGTPRTYIAMVVIMMCGSFLSSLNQNLINTALPALMNAFMVSASQAQWLVSGYTLANGVMIPITAYLIGRFSTRKMYFWAMGLFAAGTVICAAAPVFPVMVLGRVVQALGAGISMTLMQTVLFTVFPPDKRGTAMGYFGLVIAFAPALGPSLAGVIVDSMPWQALFLIQIPILVVLVVLAFFLVKNVTGGDDGTLDKLSVVLSTVGFGGVLLGFSSAGEAGFASASVIVPIIVGAVAIAWFVVRQLRLTTPMLEFRTFACKGFTPALILAVGSWAVFNGAVVVLPLFMQNMNGFTATESGLTLIAGGIVMGILSPVVGNLFDRFGVRVLAPAGFVCIAAAQVAFAVIGSNATMPNLAIAYVVLVVGLTMCNTPLTTASINMLPQKFIAHGSAMNNTLRQVIAAMCTAILIALMSIIAGPDAVGADQIPGAQAVFIILAVVSAIMAVVAVVVFRKNGGKPAAAAPAAPAAPEPAEAH